METSSQIDFCARTSIISLHFDPTVYFFVVGNERAAVRSVREGLQRGGRRVKWKRLVQVCLSSQGENTGWLTGGS